MLNFVLDYVHFHILWIQYNLLEYDKFCETPHIVTCSENNSTGNEWILELEQTMATILETFSCSLWKIFVFEFKFHWTFFPRDNSIGWNGLTLSQSWPSWLMLICFIFADFNMFILFVFWWPFWYWATFLYPVNGIESWSLFCRILVQQPSIPHKAERLAGARNPAQPAKNASPVQSPADQNPLTRSGTVWRAVKGT